MEKKIKIEPVIRECCIEGIKQVKLNMYILSHSLYENTSLSFKEVEYSHFIG